jgi:hypothetical protein
VSATPKTDAAQKTFDRAAAEFVVHGGEERFQAGFEASVELLRAQREEGVADPFEGRKF